MIVVTAATGQLGRLVITELLQRVPASEIVAAVRNVEKAADLAALGVQVRHADYTDPASLDAALQGASRVLLISSDAIGQRVAQHSNVIDAAVRAGVGLLAYTSVLRADSSVLGLAAEHRATEALLQASGLTVSLLRNGWYQENYTGNLGAALAHGVLLGSAGPGRIAAAARADYAAAAAVVLTTAQPAALYELAGDSGFTLAELAQEVSRQSGKPVQYQHLPQPDYYQALLGFGLPEGIANLVADSDAAAAQGALDDDGGVLSRLIGRPTRTLAEAVRLAL